MATPAKSDPEKCGTGACTLSEKSTDFPGHSRRAERTTIGPPAKRHLKGVLLTGWLWPAFMCSLGFNFDHVLCWERSDSVVECLTRDRGATGSSLTGVTALWSLSKTHLS